MPATKTASEQKSAAKKAAGAKAGKEVASKRSATKSPAARSTAAKASASKPADGSAVRKKSAARKATAKKPVAAQPAGSVKKTSTGTKHPSASRSPADKYTDPDLREHIKEDVLQGDKGGRPGQWSARKAQMVAHEYEAEGGGYKGGRDETQQSLTHWGEEHWTTSDGKPAERADGMHRYLPEAAWDKLSPEEKKATDRKKLEGDHKGEQFVPNTAKASKARKSAIE